MRERSLTPRALGVALAVLAAMASPAASETEAAAALARYIVFEVEADGTVRPQKHSIVRLAGGRRSLTEAEVAARLAAPARESARIVVRLFADSGEIVYEDVVEIPRWLRVESASETGELESRWLEAPNRSFVVRLPVLERSRLSLAFVFASGAPVGAVSQPVEFDVDALAADQTLPLSGFLPTLERRIVSTGSPANRVDLLVMGDGYMAAEAGKFDADATNLVNSFFGIAPYTAYRPFHNSAKLFSASPQSGADHPAYDAGCPSSAAPNCCADPPAQTDPKAGTFVTTAFDATYCAYNTHRLLTVDQNKIFAAAAAVPDWDHIVVVVNDTTYGGSGGTVAVASTNASAILIAQHEYGHSFTDLTDEYESPFPGFPACSDIVGPACEPNATDQTARASIKWAAWIQGATPVPTPETAQYASAVGLFEGARFLATGMFRPRQNCLMRTLGQPFCQICAQEFVLKLYEGGWGVPAAGIDTIEPGSESPAPGGVFIPFPGSQTFSATFLSPTTGLTKSWLVNDVVVAGATGTSYTLTPSAAGTYKVELRTKDPTPVVHPSESAALQSSRVWNVSAGGSGRFRIQVTWRVPSQNRSGVGTEVPLTSDTRYFWFFTSANIELVIKVLDGRALNGHYWVFYGALSSVEYTITITDTSTGAVKTYFNPSGQLASVADVDAFAEPPPPGAGAAEAYFETPGNLLPEITSTPASAQAPVPAACTPDALTLCLNGGRFQVRVAWSVPAQNRSGTGTAVAVTSDTGYFWFFTSANIELVIKVLDGRSLNDHFWVFYGALSNVQYTITVTDTTNGAVKTYTNPSGTLASVADTSAF